MFPLQIKDPKSYVIAGSGSITWTTTNDLVNNVATRVKHYRWLWLYYMDNY